MKQFNLPIRNADLESWKKLIDVVDNLHDEIEIALVGKYTELHDAYLSVNEALRHAGFEYKHKVNINFIDSEKLEGNVNLAEIFQNSSGIIVPGGFGMRGIEGMIKAINYASPAPQFFVTTRKTLPKKRASWKSSTSTAQ